MIFLIWVLQLRRSTLPTLIRSLSIDDTPTAVLISVGHSEHSVTVIAEVRNDFSNQESVPSHVHCADHQCNDRQPGQWRYRLENLHQRVDRGVEYRTHAAEQAERHGDQCGNHKACEHRVKTGENLVQIGGLAVIRTDFDFGGRVFSELLLVAGLLALVILGSLWRVRRNDRPAIRRLHATPRPGREWRRGWC